MCFVKRKKKENRVWIKPNADASAIRNGLELVSFRPKALISAIAASRREREISSGETPFLIYFTVSRRLGGLWGCAKANLANFPARNLSHQDDHTSVEIHHALAVSHRGWKQYSRLLEFITKKEYRATATAAEYREREPKENSPGTGALAKR